MTSMPVPYVGRHRRNRLPLHRADRPVDACPGAYSIGQVITDCRLCRSYPGRHRKDTP